MTSITISDIDDDLQQRLQARAAARGRSLVEEVRDILRDALGSVRQERVPGNLGDAIRAIVDPIGGIELEVPPRNNSVREPPNFE